MNRRRTLLLAIMGLALVGILVVFLRPKKSDQPLARLELVRQSIEQGQPVVVFTVQAPHRRRMRVENVYTFEVGKHKKMSRAVVEKSDGVWVLAPLNWPVGEPEWEPKVTLIARTNAPVWKVRATVEMEKENFMQRLAKMPHRWSILRKRLSLVDSTRWAWAGFNNFESLSIESGPITNAVAPEVK